MKARRKKTREHMNDLLIPILCVLCLMPFIVYLAEYDYGYSIYPWHSENSVARDLYAYYRSYFFELVTVITLCVLVLRLVLYRERAKPGRIFLPLAVYAVFTVLSTVFSVNVRASLTGNFYQFQSVFVLLGFCLMAFYTYQVMEEERDYRTVAKGIVIVFLLISISGWFQIFGHDLLNYEWVQRLIMSEEQFAEYRGTLVDVFSGNNVFLTLYNPNYAAVFLVMFAAVFAALACGAQEKRKRVFWLLLLLSALVFMWFTYTRAALAALAAGAAVFALCRGKALLKSWKYILSGALVLILLAVGADAWNGFHFFSRLTDPVKETKIEEICTGKDGIALIYDDVSLCLSVENGRPSVKDGEGNEMALKQDESGAWQIPFDEPIRVSVAGEDEEISCTLQIEGYPLEFVRTEEGYFYRTEDGRQDEMKRIDKIDMHGLEYLGSGRFYIWSRVIPMLKNYLFLGSGPDTFAEVFPQNDYVGKMVYAESARRVMEGAHNDYLNRWVQTGLVSLLSLFVFYVLFFRRCFSFYRRCSLYSVKHWLGFGCFLACVCYMTCCLFCDSSLYTTPVFYIFAGIALAAAAEK